LEKPLTKAYGDHKGKVKKFRATKRWSENEMALRKRVRLFESHGGSCSHHLKRLSPRSSFIAS